MTSTETSQGYFGDLPDAGSRPNLAAPRSGGGGGLSIQPGAWFMASASGALADGPGPLTTEFTDQVGIRCPANPDLATTDGAVVTVHQAGLYLVQWTANVNISHGGGGIPACVLTARTEMQVSGGTDPAWYLTPTTPPTALPATATPGWRFTVQGHVVQPVEAGDELRALSYVEELSAADMTDVYADLTWSINLTRIG